MFSMFRIDGPVYGFLKRLTNIMTLSFYWLICCIPIFTIGPATAAMYYVSLKIARHEDPPITRSFFHSFKDNFKKCTLLTLLFIVIAVVLYLDYWILSDMTGTMKSVMSVILVFFGFCFVLIATYTFPLLAQFENTIRQTLKNALLLAIRYLPRTILMIVYNLIPFAVFWFFPNVIFQYLPLWLFVAPGLIAALCCHELRIIFKPMVEPDEEEEEKKD